MWPVVRKATIYPVHQQVRYGLLPMRVASMALLSIISNDGSAIYKNNLFRNCRHRPGVWCAVRPLWFSVCHGTNHRLVAAGSAAGQSQSLEPGRRQTIYCQTSTRSFGLCVFNHVWYRQCATKYFTGCFSGRPLRECLCLRLGW